MQDILIIVILLAIVGAAAWYVIRAKKRGKKCIGCPDGCCSKTGESTCCCGCKETPKE